MSASQPAHVLGDVISMHLANDGSRVYKIEIQTSVGRQHLLVQSQYVLVGDELEDLYDDDYPEDAFLDDYEEEVAA